MKSKLITFAIILGLLLVSGIISGLLILLSFGIGWLVQRILPFTAFEATLLSLIAMTVVILAILMILFRLPPQTDSSLYKIEEGEEDFEEDEEEDEPLDDLPPVVFHFPKRGRGKVKGEVIIPAVAPDARCPCGSGRKYKNCHGRINKE